MAKERIEALSYQLQESQKETKWKEEELNKLIS